jgi:hypothetical protein
MKKKFGCFTCNKFFDTEDELQNHRDVVHSVVYLPIQKDDLSRLRSFLYTGDRSLLTKTLVEVIDKYCKAVAKKEMTKSAEDML